MMKLSLAVFVSIWSAPVSPQVLQGPIQAVPATYFGMHFHKADSGTAWPRTAGIGTWRLWDAKVIWPDIEPRRGARDFSRLDRYVAMAGVLKVDLVMALGMTPTWASARPTEKGPYGAGVAAEPRDITDWEAFVSSVAQRYVGRIRTYDIWNEVNAGTGFFTGSPQAMLDLQRSAYNRIKAIDPQAVVVSPSGVGSTDAQLKWFEDYLKLGAARYADAIGYHFYLPRLKPETLPALVSRVRGIMNRQGAGDKPLWNTESGYRMDLGQGDRAVATDPTWPKLDEATAAAYVPRRMVLGWVSGLQRYYWYAWDNAEMGFLRTDGSLTPAGYAFGRIARWMTNSIVDSCTSRSGNWHCGFRRDGARAWLVWSEGGNGTIDPEILRSARCVASIEPGNVNGAFRTIPSAGIAPLLLNDCAPVWEN